jgi:hypothetical protein
MTLEVPSTFLKITRTRIGDDDEELDDLELYVSFKNKNYQVYKFSLK